MCQRRGARSATIGPPVAVRDHDEPSRSRRPSTARPRRPPAPRSASSCRPTTPRRRSSAPTATCRMDVGGRHRRGRRRAAATARSRWPAGSGSTPSSIPQNRGYGGNQKTCYREALARGADIVVMVHPDHQYDPTYVPAAGRPAPARRVRRGLRQPHARRPAARGRHAEVEVPGQHLPDGGRERHLLRLPLGVPLGPARLHPALPRDGRPRARTRTTSSSTPRSSPRACRHGMRIREIPIETRYFPEASQIGFWRSVEYGLSVLWMLVKYKLHKKGLRRSPLFEG